MTFFAINDIMWALAPNYSASGEGGGGMSVYLDFLMDVAAGITVYLICKWLDVLMRGDK